MLKDASKWLPLSQQYRHRRLVLQGSIVTGPSNDRLFYVINQLLLGLLRFCFFEFELLGKDQEINTRESSEFLGKRYSISRFANRWLKEKRQESSLLDGGVSQTMYRNCVGHATAKEQGKTVSAIIPPTVNAIIPPVVSALISPSWGCRIGIHKILRPPYGSV